MITLTRRMDELIGTAHSRVSEDVLENIRVSANFNIRELRRLLYSLAVLCVRKLPGGYDWVSIDSHSLSQ